MGLEKTNIVYIHTYIYIYIYILPSVITSGEYMFWPQTPCFFPQTPIYSLSQTVSNFGSAMLFHFKPNIAYCWASILKKSHRCRRCCFILGPNLLTAGLWGIAYCLGPTINLMLSPMFLPFGIIFSSFSYYSRVLYNPNMWLNNELP